MDKAFYKSKGFWGGIGGLVTGVGQMFMDGHLSAASIAMISTSLIAIYGRIVATGPLSISG